MISLAAPWALLLLPLPLLVWRLVPPHREREAALRFPFFRRVAEAAGAAPRAGATILSRPALATLAGALCWCLVVLPSPVPSGWGRP